MIYDQFGKGRKNVTCFLTALKFKSPELITKTMTICGAGSADLIVALTGTADWEIDIFIDGVFDQTYTASSSPYPINVSAAGTYSINEVRDNAPGSPTLGTVFGNDIVVTVSPLPIVVASNDGPICAGETVNLTENGGDATTWLWTSDGSASFDNNGIATPVASNAVNGEIFTVQVSDGTCSNSTTTTNASGGC